MLEEAANKGVYKDLSEHQLGNPEDYTERFKNQFDFVTCAGLINNNHMDYLLFEEMLLGCYMDHNQLVMNLQLLQILKHL